MFGGSFHSVYSPRSEHVIASPKGGRLHVSPSMFKEDASSAQLLLDPATCHHCRTLRYDTNVLVLQRLNELSTISVVNLALAIACVMYLGSTVVLLIFTMVPGTTSDSQIHRLEFGGTFIFTLVTTLALIFSPERKFHSPLLLKVLVLVNVCSSFVAFLLVYISLSSFERLAHEIEYANELCTAVVDVLIILTLELKGDAALQRRQRSKLAILGLLAVCVPVLQLTVYNSAWGGEIRARYVEFCFNSTSAAVSFWFCSDSMFTADRLKMEVMLAPTDLAVVIDAESRRAVHNHGVPNTYLPPSPVTRPAEGPTPPCNGCTDCANCKAPRTEPLETTSVVVEPGIRISKGILPLPPDLTLSARPDETCVPCE